MYCNKKKKRTINNIFEVINCGKCEKYQDDEVILIGKNAISIYPIFKGCENIKHDFLSECFSERLIRMLNEISNYLNYKDDMIFLWANDKETDFIYNLGLFEAFINQGLNFCIIY